MLTSRYKDSPLGYNEGIIRYRVPDTYASEEPPFYTFARSSFTTSASTRVLARVVKELLAVVGWGGSLVGAGDSVLPC